MSLRVLNNLFRYRKSLTCPCNLINQSRVFPVRQCHNDNPWKKNDGKEHENISSSVSISEKYKAFKDEDAPVIFDVSEEMARIHLEELEKDIEYRDPYEGINMEHGVHGVFDIEDLVALLKKDNAQDIFVASVPKSLSYIDYIVIVTSRSTRHMRGLLESVRKAYKIKRHKKESIPLIEGSNCTDWQALDLGNIALHVLSLKARETYDLETLWCVGSEHDDLTNAKDEHMNLLETYHEMLKGFEPDDSAKNVKAQNK